MLIYHLSLCSEFVVNCPLVIKETHKHGLDLWQRHACSFWPSWILCFPLHALSFCFRVVLKTPRFITDNDPHQTSLHLVKDRIKYEDDVISGHVSRFEAPFLRKIFSFPNLPLQSVALFPYSYSILLLLSHLIFDLSAPRFVLCPHTHLSFAFSAVHFLGRLAHFLALPWTACAIQKHSISS